MELKSKNFPEDIVHVSERIIEMLHPQRIYLFGNKRGERGKTTGFKLCVIVEHEDRAATERDVYVNVECNVPFDVLLYSPQEWAELCAKKGSFAQKVAETGVLVYE